MQSSGTALQLTDTFGTWYLGREDRQPWMSLELGHPNCSKHRAQASCVNTPRTQACWKPWLSLTVPGQRVPLPGTLLPGGPTSFQNSFLCGILSETVPSLSVMQSQRTAPHTVPVAPYRAYRQGTLACSSVVGPCRQGCPMQASMGGQFLKQHRHWCLLPPNYCAH